MPRNARRSMLIMLAGIIGYDVYSWYLAVTVGAWQLYVVAGIVFLFGLVDGVGLLLDRRGQSARGLWATVLTFLVTDLVIGWVVKGLGFSLGIIAPVLTAAMVAQALPPRQAWRAILVGLVAGSLIAASDVLGGSLLAFRTIVPALQTFTRGSGPGFLDGVAADIDECAQR